MIEVSAAPSPALALPGAVIPAVPAAASGEGVQNPDFSTVLAGATLATEVAATPAAAPALPETTATLPVKQVAAAAANDGKTGICGNETGKALPGGKRAVTRKTLAEAKPAPKDVRGTDTSDRETPPVAARSDTVGGAIPMVQPDLASRSTLPLVKGAISAPTTSSAMVSQEQRNATSPATPAPLPAITLAQIVPPLPIATLVAIDPKPVGDVRAETPSQQAAAAIADATVLATETGALPKGNQPTAAKAAQPMTAPTGNDLQPAQTPTAAVAEPIEHKPAHAVQASAAEPLALATRTEVIAAPAQAEVRSASPHSSIGPNAATAPTQDIATLVDRITEARAAAAPNVVRAAMVHEDFGAVSLNFRTDDAHIHVTLGSADPGFAPAVHAAAAASLASGTKDDNARRDHQTPDRSPQAQDTATQNNASFQQQASRERTAAGGERGTPRETAFRQPSGSAERGDTSSAPQRRSGIYA